MCRLSETWKMVEVLIIQNMRSFIQEKHQRRFFVIGAERINEF